MVYGRRGGLLCDKGYTRRLLKVIFYAIKVLHEIKTRREKVRKLLRKFLSVVMGHM